jgi:hypothetical protein
MAKLINASICLTDIEKGRIQIGKNGKKYLNISISVNDEKDKFDNDVQISHSQTKEEREKKDKRIYLGNGKVVWSSEPKAVAEATTTNNESPIDDLPF